MATCIYCGGQIPDNAKFCTNCGAALPVEAPIEQPVFDAADQQPGTFNPAAAQPYQDASANQQQPYQQQPYQQPYQQQPQFGTPGQQPAVNDSGSIGWGILGFLIPIVGIVLFFVWRTTKPKSANVALIGAVISIVLAFIFQFVGALH